MTLQLRLTEFAEDSGSSPNIASRPAYELRRLLILTASIEYYSRLVSVSQVTCLGGIAARV